MNNKKQVALIILDGWGHREDSLHNAIIEAKTPFYDSLIEKYPHTLLNASEEHVGLPGGTIGNSEIGHMTMGAGKVINTDLVKINKAFAAGEFHTNPAFLGLFNHVKKYNSSLHILGMVSPGGVHSHQAHLHELLKAAKQAGLTQVVIHAFTDGRDMPPQSGAKYLKELEDVIKDLGIGYIATATGRYFAMDRDQNWHRTEKAEKAIFEALGKTYKSNSPSDVLADLYKQGIIDELLEPLVFLDDQGKSYPVKNNDAIFFFNFRSDRPRQLSKKITERAKAQNLFFCTMTEYHPSFESQVAFPQTKIETTLAAEISKAGLTQAHIAETEKYAHVTFFFNGGRQEPHEGEDDILIESRRDIATHDEAPEMRAHEIADKAIERLEAGDNFIIMNFANADMVGHTANKPAIIIAVETIDKELKRVVEKIISVGGTALITADHGNAELNVDLATGTKHTAHTTNLVPFILVSKLAAPLSGVISRSAADEKSLKFDKPSNIKGTLHSSSDAFGLGRDDKQALIKSSGSLANIAPTVLELLQIKKPSSMTAESLLK